MLQIVFVIIISFYYVFYSVMYNGEAIIQLYFLIKYNSYDYVKTMHIKTNGKFDLTLNFMV